MKKKRPEFAYSMLLLLSYYIINCYITLSRADECAWKFDLKPPSVDILFCDPFHENSTLSIPCQVSGLSEVELAWYFASSSGDRMLMNSSKHELLSSVVHGNDSVTVSLNVTFSNLEETADGGKYFCRAKVKNSGNDLLPYANFTISYPSINFGIPVPECDKPLIDSEKASCAKEIISLSYSSSLLTSASINEVVDTTAVVATPATTSSINKYTAVVATPAITSSMRSTPTSTKPLTTTKTTLITTAGNIAFTKSSSSSISYKSSASKFPVEEFNSAMVPPVSTWFYLLSVVVVLTFLIIILVLILMVFCIKKRSSGRHTVHLPSLLPEEIGVHKTGRKPSDPLPNIRGNVGTEDGVDLYYPNLPKCQIISAPLNRTTGHALSLQHLAFNLSPSFRSNSTVYDEIDPPEHLNIARAGSHDYVNKWPQFTIQSDDTGVTYDLPPDANNTQELSCCIEAPLQLHINCPNTEDSVSDDSNNLRGINETMATSSTTGSMWLNSPVIVPQCTPWRNSTNTFGGEQVQVMSTSPIESSGSAFLSDDLPNELSDGESSEDDSTQPGSCCMVVQENHQFSSLTANTLNGQMFELSSTNSTSNDGNRLMICGMQSKNVASPGSSGSSAQQCSINDHNPQTNIASPAPPTNYSIQEPSSLPSDSGMVSKSENDNSRSSSSTSGCTDISKYSGDYDRDPNYMRHLLCRMRLGDASPETMNNVCEIRADSGMESLYTEATPTATNDENLSQSDSHHVYKSLNSLTLQPESIYTQSYARPNCEPFQNSSNHSEV